MENGAFAPNIFKYMIFQRCEKALLWSIGLFIMDFQYVCFDALCPNQQFISHVWTIYCLPVLSSGSSVLLKDTVQRLRQGWASN